MRCSSGALAVLSDEAMRQKDTSGHPKISTNAKLRDVTGLPVITFYVLT